ncbi:oxidoreductase [Cercophora newfieldiana]|uniref:Oxidoreductase n=1 Tax=Cercophora newfieldiana TaxID=92897 RepID=A0AA40CQ17_9PEZI|nr:oxidoreductase [Cercophora newfieldiana]
MLFSNPISVLGSALLGFAAAAHASSILPSVFQARQITQTSQLLSAYDYVIVGGGTSGLTVADRLTENPHTTVLVLEAGSFPKPEDVLPVTDGGTRRQENYLYQSIPQKNLNNQSFFVVLGNMVGGSSGINGMMTARGSAEDYDRWGKLFERDSKHDWSWKGMLPYFKKSISFFPPPADVAKRFNMKYDASYWGKGSAVDASWPSYQYPGLDPLLGAFKELPGIEFTADSGAGGAGVYWFPTFMDPVKRERSYATNGHYSNVKRPNYHLIADTPVRRVLLKDGAAFGVELTKDNKTFTIPATKEVLVTAGAIHTPQILQRSGIGPRKVIEAAGIKTLVDLPGVGQNFQDHPEIKAEINLGGLLQIHPNAHDLEINATFRQWAEESWSANRSGPYSIAFGNIAAWLPLTAVSPSKYKSLSAALSSQNHSAYLPPGTHPTVAAGYTAQMRGLAQAMLSPSTVFARILLNGTTGAVGPVLNQPFSRGSVNIDTTDPFGRPPVIDFNGLSNPVERAVMVEMIKFYRRYHSDTALAKLAPNETAPGKAVASDAEIDAWLPSGVTPSDWHAAGTAAMMPLELGGVVDQTLRVYGVKKLRVIDASVIPTLPGGNPCHAVYAIAEKVADLIKAGV